MILLSCLPGLTFHKTLLWGTDENFQAPNTLAMCMCSHNFTHPESDSTNVASDLRGPGTYPLFPYDGIII